jgi:sugar O-acyltransferase (sialic acid O-acetyltransferase NeuD family)
MSNKVLVFGNQDVAALNHFYLTHDSPYEVVAFTVDQAYITEDTLCGLPVVPFEHVEAIYSPKTHKMSVFLGFRDVNRFRAEKFAQAKAKGYELISYVSSKASTWPDLVLGKNSVIAENVVVQPYVKIGNDVVIAAGAVIGHHAVIQDHCFVAAHSVILGDVTVEQYSVLGANCTIKDGVTVGRQCIIGAGCYISGDAREKGIYVNRPAELLPKSSDELSRLLTWAEDVKRTQSDGF